MGKSFDIEECYQCEDLKKEGSTQKTIEKAHDDCHGWYHCGSECCGLCPVCGG